MSKALEYLLSQPLLCTVEAAEVAASIVSREGTPGLVEGKKGSKIEGSETGMYRRNGVAVIPVCGPIHRYADFYTEMCGGVTTKGIALDLTSALQDPTIGSILLNIDSPGGEAAGIGELAAMIRKADAVKPVCAYAGDQMCSAAAWLGMAAGEVVCSETASVGSIGVVMGMKVHADRAGTKSYEFVSTQSPNKRPNPDTDDGKALIQKRCDDLCGVFVEHVAAYRGVTTECVASDFGKGGVLIGRDAVAAGMADRVGDFESTLARLARGERLPKKAPKTTEPKPSNSQIGYSNQPKGTRMNVGSILSAFFKANPDAAAKAVTDAGATEDLNLAHLATVLRADHGSRIDPDPAGSRVQAKTEAEIRADLKAENDKEMRAFYAVQASDWFDAQVAAGKVIPATKARVCALYVDAATADRVSGPVKFEAVAGSPETISRLSQLTSSVASAPDNGKTSEAIPVTDGKTIDARLKGVKILDHAEGPETSAEKRAAERIRKSLEAVAAESPAAKAALAALDN